MHVPNILMGDLSLQLQHHLLKYSHFNGSPDSNRLNLRFINGTPKLPTASKARTQSLSSKTRTYPPNFHNPRFKITNPATKIKGNPVRRRVELDRFRRKKPIPGYIRSWGQNNMAAVYEDLKLLCQEGQLDEALTILRVMDCRGDIPVDANIYDFLLEGCKVKKYLQGGRQVHNHMMLTGFHRNAYLATKLIQLYSVCGSLADAQKAFDAVPEKNSYLWNALLRTFVKDGFYMKKSIDLYKQMKFHGIEPDNYALSSVLKACGSLVDLQNGMEIHGEAIKRGYESEAVVGGALVDMYCKCDSVSFARKVFDKISKRNVINWSAMISGFLHNWCWEDAVECFVQMLAEGCLPNSVTLCSVLPACGLLAALREGKEIHGYIIRNGFDSYEFLASSLVDMYMKCGCVEYARQVFNNMSERNVVTCSAMVDGYTKNGHAREAFQVFIQMQRDGVKPNAITIANILPSCVDLAAPQQGKEIHGYIIKCGFLSNIFVAHSLIDLYSKFGIIEDGLKVFDEISDKGVISWTVMIAGYGLNGYAKEALALFHQMREDGVKPSLITILKILPACSDVAVPLDGKKIHAYAIKSGFDSHASVSVALIEMYGRCGCIDIAEKVFGNISEKQVTSWTAMISAYGINTYGKKALEIFNEMQQEHVKPNEFTFYALLTACSNAGLVAEGWQYFNMMNQNHYLPIGVEHYACMVELLGRAGQLNEAHNLIQNMTIKYNASVWRALLGACNNHCNVGMGEYAAEHLQELEALHAGDFITLANIYAATGKWDKADKVRTNMILLRLKGMPDWSGVVVKSRMHTFVRGDKLHPQSEKIYTTLEGLAGEIKAAGYMLEPYNLLDVKKEDTEYIFCGHSITLALTFGLMNSSPGLPIWLVQNHRMCRDCHSVTKVISKITGKKIIARDNKCIHHFEGGECACRDYW